jgi:hypothetical protein
MAATTSPGHRRPQVLDMFQALSLLSIRLFHPHLTHLPLSLQRVLTLHLRDLFQDLMGQFSFPLQAQSEVSIETM